jgi:hypothetical protein
MKVYLTTCCKEKRPDEDLLPAKERYQSPRVRYVVAESERIGIPLLFFSGKYGILGAHDLIPWYAKQLMAEDVEGMVPVAIAQLRERGITEINLFGRPRERPSWIPYYAVIDQACDALGIKVTHKIVDYT